MDVVSVLQKGAVRGIRVNCSDETVRTWNQGTATIF